MKFKYHAEIIPIITHNFSCILVFHVTEVGKAEIQV